MQRNRTRVFFLTPPCWKGSKALERQLFQTKERYQRLPGPAGADCNRRYRPGSQLPSYKELQTIYEVSADTVSKAIKILQGWGVVETVRGNGVFVTMDLEALKKIEIEPSLIASHLRRYLDSLELIS